MKENREEAAGFLQTWLLFRTTGEIFGVSITPSAFVWVDKSWPITDPNCAFTDLRPGTGRAYLIGLGAD